MRTRLLAFAGLVAVLVAVIVVIASRGPAHRVFAAFDQAENVVSGLQVRVAGVPVGSIGSERLQDGHAVLELDISDSRVWPLRLGTVARLRFGPTAGYAVRYVQLTPGPFSAPPLPDGSLLTPASTQTPVEVDDLLRVLDRQGRAAVRSYLSASERALAGRGEQLGATIGAASGTAGALAQVSDELARSRSAVSALVSAGARVTATLSQRDGDLQSAVSGLAGTFSELADRQSATLATLRRLPTTLALARSTLAKADPSIDLLHQVATVLAPAARQLRLTSLPLSDTLTEVRRITPSLITALAHGVRDEPAISGVLGELGPFAVSLGDVLARARPMLACIRPYTPELAGVLSTWAGYSKDYDSLGHFARAELQVSPSFYNGVPLTPQQFVKLIPGTTYALPRAPGADVGQPWYQPQCGATLAATNPANDPESRP